MSTKVESAPETLPALSETGRVTMLWIVSLLRSGYTGRIELECNHGAVRRVQQHQVFEPKNGEMCLRGGGGNGENSGLPT